MIRNIAMRLAYDGTDFHGWQIQKAERTVQGELKAALARLGAGDVALTGCGRTDAGVHAARYCANFKSALSIPCDRLPLAVNAQLPPDVAVQAAVEAPADFNAVLSCVKKEYTYTLVNARIRDPLLRDRAYFYPTPLDLDVMRAAAAQFVGTHDFAAVRSVGTETKTTVRTVHWCELARDGDRITMRICADGFLYNMVRAIMGTLLYCSERKIAPAEIPALLAAGNRRLTGPTVPPQGLCLTRVWYDGPVGAMMEP